MSIFTPLRYPGGKGKLTPYIKQLFRYNNLDDGTYIEPYAGGAAVALSLLLEGYAWDIVINDIDTAVYAFWWSVVHDAEELSKKIADTPVTMDTWHRQKFVYQNQKEFTRPEVGFATFFLNRTNRSGIMRAGVIGGKNQDGPYKIDARYNKTELLRRINLIAKYSGRIKVLNEDAFDLIADLSRRPPIKCLLYCDPPYFQQGKFLYKNSYTKEDHVRIAKLVKSLSIPWMVTYDNAPEIQEIYAGELRAEFDISYSAHVRRVRGDEVMFYKNLQLPSAPYSRMAG